MKTTKTTSIEEQTYAAELQAFALILSGLCASGHYTEPPTECEEGLIHVDLGEDWADNYADDPAVQRRYAPNVLFAAETLWKDSRKFIRETLKAEANSQELGI
jgi:hypothetical protein